MRAQLRARSTHAVMSDIVSARFSERIACRETLVTYRTAVPVEQAARTTCCARRPVHVASASSASARRRALRLRRQLAHDIFKQLIEINTTDSSRKHHGCGAGHGAAAARCGISRPRTWWCSGRTIARATWWRATAAGRGRTSGRSDHRPPGRGGGAARGLEHGSLPVRREGRLLLRPRHAGHEGQRRHRGRRLHPAEKGGLRPGPRHHPRAHRGRGGRHLQRRRLAAQESPRPRRRRIRTKSGFGRRARRHGKPHDGGVRGHREALRGLSAARHQSRRPQFAAEAGQRDLSRGGRARGLQKYRVPVRAERVTREYFDADGARSSPRRRPPTCARSCKPARCGGDRAPVEGSALQLDHAHDLRGHPAQRRARIQRAAAARRSQCQLPHLSRALAGGDPARAGKAVQRSALAVRYRSDTARCSITDRIARRWSRRRCGPT